MSLSAPPPSSSSQPGLLDRAARGAWAVADQGLFAGANFLLHILMARWLLPAEYGALAVGWAVLFGLGAMHVALLGEPMLVFGAGRFAGRDRAYLGAVMAGHWAISLAVAALLVLGGALASVAGSPEMATALMGLGLAAPFVLLLWLSRRACYLDQRPQRAAAAGGVYLLLIVLGLLALRWQQWLNLPGALAVVGLSSAAVGLALGWMIRPQYRGLEREMLGEVVRSHLGYGRWSMGTNAAIFLSGHVFFILTAAMVGLGPAGELRAMVNLVLPMQLVGTAVAMLLVPNLVRAESPGQRRRLLVRALLVLGLGSAAYWAALGLFQGLLFGLAYGEQYRPAPLLVWVLGITLLTGAVAEVAGAALRAAERPDLVFKSFAAATVLALIGGAVLIHTMGLAGAVIAMSASGLLAAAALLLNLRRRI